MKVTRVPPGATGKGLLLCHVDAFSPRDVDIQWMGGPDLQARAETGPVTGREVFSILSVLRLVDGEEGRGYACVVRHPALDGPMVATEEAGKEGSWGGTWWRRGGQR